MSGNRISRKEIKRNDLAATLSGLTHAAETHLRSFLIALGAVVLLGVAVGAGFWYSRSRAAQAGRQLAVVQSAAGYLLQGAEEAPVKGAASSRAQDVITKADALLRDYPSSAAARWATYYKALGQKESGDLSGALSTLTPLAADGANDLLCSVARVMQAQIHEQQGDHAAAAEIYTALAASPAPAFPADMALAGQARALEAQGKTDEAAAITQRLQQEFSDSPYARQAAQNPSSQSITQ